jgi:hypothetical protein
LSPTNPRQRLDSKSARCRNAGRSGGGRTGGRRDAHFVTVQDRSMKGEASLWGRGAGSGIRGGLGEGGWEGNPDRGSRWCVVLRAEWRFLRRRRGQRRYATPQNPPPRKALRGAVALVRDCRGLPTKEDLGRGRSSAAGARSPPRPTAMRQMTNAAQADRALRGVPARRGRAARSRPEGKAFPFESSRSDPCSRAPAFLYLL